jgi:hypothetical protein
MSFLGLGRPQPSSAEKIAAVENELKVVAEMHSRYAVPLHPNPISPNQHASQPNTTPQTGTD